MEEDKKLNWKIPWRGVGVAFGSGLLALYLVFRKVAPPGEILDELRVYPLSYFCCPWFCAGSLDCGRTAHRHACSGYGTAYFVVAASGSVGRR